MDADVRKITATFKLFFDSEKSGGVLLIACTIISLVLTNSKFQTDYLDLWQIKVAGMDLVHWINDALMAIFFLLIGLELERELYSGELSDYRNALLPIFAAAGGICIPALIHFIFNAATPAQAGIGIPMATDIAFALGILALLGDRVPASLKVFMAALAVIDDLGAIAVIAFFYTAKLSVAYLIGAIGVFCVLIVLNRFFRVTSLVPYLLGGALFWFFMHQSGVHATIAGVMLAFAIPFSARDNDEKSPSHRLEHFLHKPVAFVIMPLFALANTTVVLGSNWVEPLTHANSLGIMAGLVLGKPLGVMLFCFVAVAFGIGRLPFDLTWRHFLGAGLLGGIGFTMSIFITNLAFAGIPEMINASKIAIIVASLAAGTAGYLWLRFFCRRIT